MLTYAKKSEIEVFREKGYYPCYSNYTRDWEYPWAYLNSNLKGRLKILDIGPGKSDFPQFLKNKGHNVSIIDIFNRKGWGIKAFLKKNQKINYQIEDVRDMSWKNDTFDRIFCISVLEHLKNQEDILKALNEIKRVVKKGGLIIITYDSYLKEFPSLRELNMEKTRKKLRLKAYKKGIIKKREIKNKDLVIASKGKILHQNIKINNFFFLKKYSEEYLDIYAVIGIIFQK